jgi:hypothetical protein
MYGSGSPFSVAGSVAITDVVPDGVIFIIRKSPA